MVSVTTNSGLSVEVDERRFADFRVVDACGVILGDAPEEDKVMAARDILHLIFTDVQLKALYKHVEKDGFVSIDDVYAELFDVLNMAKLENSDVKKS